MKNALVFLYESQADAEVTLEQIAALEGLGEYYLFAIISFDAELIVEMQQYPFDEIFVHKTRGMPSHRAFARSFKEIFDRVILVEAGETVRDDLLEEKDEIYSWDAPQWRSNCVA